jgi:hypothetical protein
MRIAASLLLLSCLAYGQTSTNSVQMDFDHIWIAVSPGAPERAVLQRSGLQFAQNVNRHKGQGTASITVEFENAFLELIWRDSDVSVEGAGARAADKFAKRADWRASGWCPFGISLRRRDVPDASAQRLPFPTWSIAPEWLPPGQSIEMFTPREDSLSPSLFISAVPPNGNREKQQNVRWDRSPRHPNGARRVTAVKLVYPTSYNPIEPLVYLRDQGTVSLESGQSWLVELTLDSGKRKESKDMRPDLPLVIHY